MNFRVMTERSTSIHLRQMRLLGYTSKREQVIRNVIGYVNQYGIDGINIDFELISQEGADDYIEVYQRIVDCLPCQQHYFVH